MVGLSGGSAGLPGVPEGGIAVGGYGGAAGIGQLSDIAVAVVVVVPACAVVQAVGIGFARTLNPLSSVVHGEFVSSAFEPFAPTFFLS